MIRFLLDEHFSPRFAAALKAKGFEAKAIAAGPLAGADDEVVFASAAAGGWTLVTADVADFSIHMVNAMRSGEPAPAVVFVPATKSGRDSIRPVVDALADLAGRVERGELDISGGCYLRFSTR